MEQVEALSGEVRGLHDAVEALRGETESLRGEIGRSREASDAAAARVLRQFRFRTVLGCVLVLAIIALGAVVTWRAEDAARRQAESDQRWCPVVTAILPGPGDPPPTTDRGRLVVAQFRVLASAFGCVVPESAAGGPSPSTGGTS